MLINRAQLLRRINWYPAGQKLYSKCGEIQPIFPCFVLLCTNDTPPPPTRHTAQPNSHSAFSIPASLALRGHTHWLIWGCDWVVSDQDLNPLDCLYIVFKELHWPSACPLGFLASCHLPVRIKCFRTVAYLERRWFDLLLNSVGNGLWSMMCPWCGNNPLGRMAQHTVFGWRLHCEEKHVPMCSP